MLYINPTDIENVIPAEWIEEAETHKKEVEKLSTIEEKKEYFKKHPIWGKIKDKLELLSHQKCWYSDTTNFFAYSHVDHYRPKWKVKNIDNTERDWYWWLAYVYSNYIFSAPVWNVNKKDKFWLKAWEKVCLCKDDNINDEKPYLLNPTKKFDVDLVYVDKNTWEIISRDLSDIWWTQRVNYTTETLNFKLLNQARLKKIEEANLLIDNTKKLLLQNKDIEGNIKLLQKFIDPKEQFSSIMKKYFKYHELDWVNNLL